MARVLAWLMLITLSSSTHADLPLNISSGPDVILKLNAFMESLFARENTTALAEWNAALPSNQEREEMMKLITELYELDDFSQLPSDSMAKFPTLAKSTELSVLEKGRYCVIHERVPPDGHSFSRFFGYAALQGRRYAKRLLHHSAAHFESDGNVCNQSAALFERTQSRSLVVAGASRYAVMGHNPSPCQKWNQVADAAHNNETMFHTMNSAVFASALKLANEQSAPFADVFAQWHGMAESSCPEAPIYISAAYNASGAVYKDPHGSVGKMHAAVKTISRGDFYSETPLTDNHCGLVATTNIFARVINGVSPSTICHHNPKPKDVLGHFVSVEQKRVPRNDWDTWTKVLLKAFPDTSSGAQPALPGEYFIFVLAVLLTQIAISWSAF